MDYVYAKDLKRRKERIESLGSRINSAASHHAGKVNSQIEGLIA
jgi:hypothetical protein